MGKAPTRLFILFCDHVVVTELLAGKCFVAFGQAESVLGPFATVRPFGTQSKATIDQLKVSLPDR
jgi:hypothetical protein